MRLKTAQRYKLIVFLALSTHWRSQKFHSPSLGDSGQTPATSESQYAAFLGLGEITQSQAVG